MNKIISQKLKFKHSVIKFSFKYGVSKAERENVQHVMNGIVFMKKK